MRSTLAAHNLWEHAKHSLLLRMEYEHVEQSLCTTVADRGLIGFTRTDCVFECPDIATLSPLRYLLRQNVRRETASVSIANIIGLLAR